MPFRILAFVCLAICSLRPVEAQDIVSIRGSNVVARALASAATPIEKDLSIRINFVAELSSTELAKNLGRGIFDIALYTRKLTGAEISSWPESKFTENLIGKQCVLVVVPDQVWKSGVRALTKEQFRMIYEGELKNWKQVGGEDREITFFNRDVGQGVWDLFMIFLYGDIRRAPLSKAEKIASADDVRTTVEFNGGSISLLEYGEFKGDRLHALGVKLDDGSIVDPTPADVASGRYPLSRPLYMVTGKRPTGKVRDLIEFMLGENGQKAVREAGHVPLKDLEPKK